MNSGLKNCQEPTGVINPNKAFDFMNDMAKRKDPEAYKSDLTKTLQQRQKRMKEQEIQHEK